MLVRFVISSQFFSQPESGTALYMTALPGAGPHNINVLHATDYQSVMTIYHYTASSRNINGKYKTQL